MTQVLAQTTHLGMQGSGDWSDPALRPLNYRKSAFKLFPDSPTPFQKFLSMIKTSSVDDPEFRIFEWRLPTMSTLCTAIEPNAETSIAVTATTGTSFKAGDLVINETTGEIMMITDTAANALTVTRAWGVGDGGIATAVGDVLRWVGDAYAEGSDVPSAISRRPSVIKNFTQIFKDVADVTGTAEKTNTRPMKPWPQLKAEALERLMIKMESAFLWGIQNETTDATSGKPWRTTGGFYKFVSAANTPDDMSSLTIDKLENAMQAAFTYGSKNKILMIGYTALNYLNKVVRANTQFNFNAPLDKKQTYGLNIRELECPFGTLSIMPHPLMAESALYTTQAYVIDPKYVEYVYLRGRDVDFHDEAQGNGEDSRKGYWMAEAGLRLALPETHAIWTGMSSLGA